MAAEPDAGTIVQCARCNEWEWAEDLYECDQCGEYVCIKCLAVPGSDNNESVCRDCPAMGHANIDKPVLKIVDGKGKAHDVSIRDMFGERMDDDFYDADGLTRADRIADGELTPADAEWLQCSAEEQGEDR